MCSATLVMYNPVDYFEHYTTVLSKPVFIITETILINLRILKLCDHELVK